MRTDLDTRTRTGSPASDSGAALLTVVMMLVLVGALTLTLAVVTINNLTSARLAQQAGNALNASDAGIAQAVTYLRENGVGQINGCAPTCATQPWGNKNEPARVTVPGKSKQTYEVWIEPLIKYPDNKVGYYRIHSTGLAGGPAGRTVEVTAEVTGTKVPIGIMAASVNGGGTADVHHESIFSTGCVYRRSKIQFEGIDLAHNIPAAVHTSQIITDDQGSGKYCPTGRKDIHASTGTPAQRYCNPAYPYDQDAKGGPLDGTSCYQTHEGTYPETSLIASDADLFAKFDLNPQPFTQSELEQLQTIAIGQGNYHQTTASWATPTQAHAVLYFDLKSTDPGGLVDLNQLAPVWSRPAGIEATDPACESRSLLIIIDGGNARLNANSTVFASTFLISGDPYGNITKSNGTSTYIGTLYGNNLDLTGTADLHMDKCFIANPSPALTGVRTFGYREADR